MRGPASLSLEHRRPMDTNDCNTPISGEIIEVNKELNEKPELVNQDPYGKGWIAKIQPENLEKELKNLMTPQEYKEHLKTL